MQQELNEVRNEVKDLKDSYHQMAITQAEVLVLLKNVLSFTEKEKSNSVRVAILENNWKWAKWVIGSLVLPVIWLLVKSFT